MCISVTTDDAGQLFIRLFAHLSIFFGEVPMKVFCPLFIGLFVILLLSFKSSLYILDTIPYQISVFQRFSYILQFVYLFSEQFHWQVNSF